VKGVVLIRRLGRNEHPKPRRTTEGWGPRWAPLGPVWRLRARSGTWRLYRRCDGALAAWDGEVGSQGRGWFVVPATRERWWLEEFGLLMKGGTV
jgi:hypothetical protein